MFIYTTAGPGLALSESDARDNFGVDKFLWFMAAVWFGTQATRGAIFTPGGESELFTRGGRDWVDLCDPSRIGNPAEIWKIWAANIQSPYF